MSPLSRDMISNICISDGAINTSPLVNNSTEMRCADNNVFIGTIGVVCDLCCVVTSTVLCLTSVLLNKSSK